jgi:hypothetical protein
VDHTQASRSVRSVVAGHARPDDDVERRWEHVVGFYERATFLADLVATSLSVPIRAGGSVLVVAKAEHHDPILAALRGSGVDVDGAVAEERLTVLDARVTLASLLVDDALDVDRFTEVVVPHVDAMLGRGGPVRIFGEMVALLWAQGRVADAMHLEELWNELGAARSFGLVCGYPMSLFADADSTEAFQQVCGVHTGVTNEGYAGLRDGPGERGPVVLDRADHVD